MKHGIAAVGAMLLATGFFLFLSPPDLDSAAQDLPSLPPMPEPRHSEPDISIAPDALAYQLLTNPGVELYGPRYAQFDGVDCQGATGWQRFPDLSLPEPCWMDCRVFANSHLGTGWVDRMEGATSQLIIGTEPYTAGIMQTVTGLTPGVGYGFHAAMLTIYQSSAPPDVDGTMLKQVGMDPAGGTDPGAPTVVWCEPDDHDANGWALDLRTAVFAESPTMTVFIRATSLYPAGESPYLNISFLDSAILAVTPVVTATSPAVSEVPTFTVNWDNAVVAPGALKLKWRDVQWLDESDELWHDWITRTYEAQAPFVGVPGHIYRFRARVWQKYENGAHLYGPYRPEGDTRTLVLGSRLVGQVLSSEGFPIAGATVAISGTNYAAVSHGLGRYELIGPGWPHPQSARVSHPGWLSPPPVHNLSLGPSDTAAITWTLLPRGDAIVNGHFEEEGLPGWTALEGGAVPPVVSGPAHTGHHSLALGEGLAVGGMAGVGQTVVVTDAWEPVLSFWYLPPAADPDDSVLTVAVSVVTYSITSTLLAAPTGPTAPVTTTQTFTPSLEVQGWHHQWYAVGLPRAYLTGEVVVEFRVESEGGEDAAAVHLDEVSLGPTPGGPERLYLPFILRSCATPVPNSGFSPIYDRIE